MPLSSLQGSPGWPVVELGLPHYTIAEIRPGKHSISLSIDISIALFQFYTFTGLITVAHRETMGADYGSSDSHVMTVTDSEPSYDRPD